MELYVCERAVARVHIMELCDVCVRELLRARPLAMGVCRCREGRGMRG
jgi:hypothetical protein